MVQPFYIRVKFDPHKSILVKHITDICDNIKFLKNVVLDINSKLKDLVVGSEI